MLPYSRAIVNKIYLTFILILCYNSPAMKLLFKQFLILTFLAVWLVWPAGVCGAAANYYEVSLNSLVFVDTELPKVLEVFSKLSNLNLFLDESVPNKKVTFFANNMPIDLAIDMFIRTNGLVRKKMNKNTYLIYPKTKSADYESELTSHVFILENDDPKKVINILKTIGKNTKVTLNDRINGIVMIDTPENIEIAKKIVRQMDYKKPQVAVDLRLVEIKRDRIKDLGIQLDKGKKDFSLTELKTFGTIKSPVLVDLLIKEHAAEVLAQPKLKVLDQEKAEIQVGDRIPIEITTSSKNAAGDNIQLTKTVQWENIGIKLQVDVSKIHNINEVTLKIFNEVSSVLEYTKEGYPHIRTRNARTVLRMNSGETVVIGGLINTEERTSVFKIPIISKLPGFGQLFRNTNKEKLNTEIIMFVTPTIFTEKDRVENTEGIDSKYPVLEKASEAMETESIRLSDIKPSDIQRTTDTKEIKIENIEKTVSGNEKNTSVKNDENNKTARPPVILISTQSIELMKKDMSLKLKNDISLESLEALITSPFKLELPAGTHEVKAGRDSDSSVKVLAVPENSSAASAERALQNISSAEIMLQDITSSVALKPLQIMITEEVKVSTSESLIIKTSSEVSSVPLNYNDRIRQILDNIKKSRK